MSIELSLVIANYNRLEWLRRCFEALEQQNAALRPRFEVVLVDDGSRAETHAFLESYRPPFALQILKQKNQGPAVARNAGTRAAHGAFVAYIDNDTCLFPEWMDVALLEELPRLQGSVVGVNGRIVPYPDPSLATPLTETLDRMAERGRLYKLLYPYNHGNTNNLIYRKQPLLDAGLFDEGFRYPAFEDADLAFRLAKRGLHLIDSDRLRAYHPSEMDWKVLRKKYLMHGHSLRRFSAKHGRRYPLSVAFLIGVSLKGLANAPLLPLAAAGSGATEAKARFMRSLYTLKGFVTREVDFQSKNA